MRLGILGSGLMSGKLSDAFRAAGQEVVFSYARSRKEELAKMIPKSRIVSAFNPVLSEVHLGRLRGQA